MPTYNKQILEVEANRFYLSCGFKEFEVIGELWGEDNPCQIYVMSLA